MQSSIKRFFFFLTALERVEDSWRIWKHFEIGFPSNFQGSLCFSHRIRWLRSGASLVNLSVAPPVKIHDHTVNATSLKLLRWFFFGDFWCFLVGFYPSTHGWSMLCVAHVWVPWRIFHGRIWCWSFNGSVVQKQWWNLCASAVVSSNKGIVLVTEVISYISYNPFIHLINHLGDLPTSLYTTYFVASGSF